MLRRVVLVLCLVAGLIAMSSAAGAAEPGAVERHCVYYVTGVADDGELAFGSQECFDSFSEALASITRGAVVVPYDTPVEVLATSPDYLSTLSTFTIGIHYDYFNGGGSSISVVGSSCVGGWWNTPGWFSNKESSAWNGCYRLKHWDYPGAAGSYQSTTGVGTTDNLSYMSNQVESVSYHSS